MKKICEFFEPMIATSIVFGGGKVGGGKNSGYRGRLNTFRLKS